MTEIDGQFCGTVQLITSSTEVHKNHRDDDALPS